MKKLLEHSICGGEYSDKTLTTPYLSGQFGINDEEDMQSRGEQSIEQKQEAKRKRDCETEEKKSNKRKKMEEEDEMMKKSNF